MRNKQGGERKERRHRESLLDDQNITNLSRRSRGRSNYEENEWRPGDEEESAFYGEEQYTYASPSPADTHYDYDTSWRGRRYDDRFNQESHQGVWDSVKNFFGKGPKGYKRSDERIHEDVCEALAKHPGIDASEIEVSVDDGVVVLKGFVDDRQIKRMAEDTAEMCFGVKDVRNELRIGTPPPEPELASSRSSKPKSSRSKTMSM